MSQRNETLSLLITLAITGAMMGGGYLWFKGRCEAGQNSFLCTVSGGAKTVASPQAPSLPPPPSPGRVTAFESPTSIAAGTSINIDGSTSMAQINVELKKVLERKFPGLKISLEAGGSKQGLESLRAGTVDIAAVSVPLTPEQEREGLMAVPVVRDAIAIVVGRNNPIGNGLGAEQVRGIFTGDITNWSAVGGSPATIRVINRPDISGTYQVVLAGAPFGSGPNFTILSRDATTPILQILGIDGISYATYTQVARQRTTRTLSVDGIPPDNPNYPFQRTLYYVYKNPPTEGVKAFLGFVSSPEGQQAILLANERLEK